MIKDDIVTFAVAMLLAGLIGGVTAGICGPAMAVGMFMMFAKKMRGEKVAIGDVFEGFQKFGPAFVVSLLGGLAIGALYLILVGIPGIVSAAVGIPPVIMILLMPIFVVGAIAVNALVLYSMPIVAYTDTGAIDALKMSIEKVKPALVMNCVLVLVCGLVGAIGSIACGLGQLISMPVAMAAVAFGYRDNFGMDGVAAAPAVPPAPAPAAPDPAAIPDPAAAPAAAA